MESKTPHLRTRFSFTSSPTACKFLINHSFSAFYLIVLTSTVFLPNVPPPPLPFPTLWTLFDSRCFIVLFFFNSCVWYFFSIRFSWTPVVKFCPLRSWPYFLPYRKGFFIPSGSPGKPHLYPLNVIITSKLLSHCEMILMSSWIYLCQTKVYPQINSRGSSKVQSWGQWLYLQGEHVSRVYRV